MQKLLTLVFLIPVLIACNKEPNAHQSPNVVMILADDAGWGDLSRNGNTAISTPHIDQLANDGLSLENFFVCAVCSPTRAEMLTGRYAVRAGVYSTSQGGERLDLDEQTIADIFKQQGYKTGAFGKWHNGMQYPYHPNARGFDEFYGYCSGHWGNYFSPMLEHNGKLVKGEGYLTNDLTHKALQFMETHKDSSFFLYLPLNTPHSPMQVPDSLWERAKNKKLNRQHRYAQQENTEHTKAALAMVENIDYNVGRVMQKLKELQLEENTIVIYFSDNGPNGYRYNGNRKGKKGHVDEGGVKTACFLQWKGVFDAGKQIQTIASGIDLLPTLADLANIEFAQAKPLDGISLKNLLLGKDAPAKERYIVNQWQGKISLRSQQFRLDENNQLFDMLTDPEQQLNVADKHPQTWQAMKAYKQQWIDDAYAELPTKDTRSFPVGHPNWEFNQLPARDAHAYGNIKRSNRWPNCSFFTNWTSLSDSITWEVEVLEEGTFEASVYYTCSPANIGSEIALSFKGNQLSKKIVNAYNPPLKGMDKDRVPRQESYVKDFNPLVLGNIQLHKGKGNITLKALQVASDSVADIRLLMLRRLD